MTSSALHGTTSLPFEWTGEFRGFVFNAVGKRRMVLRRGEEEFLLKVPKEMRRRVAANFRIGEAVRVSGVEERDTLSGASFRRTVTRIVPARADSSPHPASSEVGPIRVCAKKNCWRSGGRELWAALECELDARGLVETIRLKAVHCLDRCKHAPNADWQGCAFRRCAPTDAAAIVATAAAAVARCESV